MSSYQGSNSLSPVLPEGLITEIITRLPAKPLCRFKLVSKRWDFVISDPNFIKSYIDRSCPPTWAILDQAPRLVNHTSHSTTQLSISDPPKASIFYVNPQKLSGKPFNFPVKVLHSSNGLFFCLLLIIRAAPPYRHDSYDFEDEMMLVVNPVTDDFVPLRKPVNKLHQTHVGFTTKLDPETGLVDKFMVVDYRPDIGSESASLWCFSSDIGEWVRKSGSYMLGGHLWWAPDSFEFRGRLFWVDLSTGLITWDEDPFVGLETKEAALCRFIPVPNGRAAYFNVPGLEYERCMGVGGGFIQFMELFKEGNCVFKLWRLTDFEVGEWSLMYKLSRDYVDRNLASGFGKGMPKLCFMHPFEPDVAYLKTGDDIFSLNVRTRKIQSRSNFTEHELIKPMVLPKWPSPLPKHFYAACTKERGNECFKRQNFNEAIKCYSKSICLSPNAAAFANRAMAYLKLNKFHEAENDCTESLKLDPIYFKVYCRRALARKELGFLRGALEDVEAGLKLEPENEDLKKLCAELKSMLVQASSAGHKDGAACDRDVEGK